MIESLIILGLINLLVGLKLMVTFDETKQKVTDLQNTLAVMDGKLDEVKAFILGLGTGGLSQAQHEEISLMLDNAKSTSDSVLAEVDALDEPAPA